MKTYKLYIRFILLISLSVLFNQQAFSKIDSLSIQQNQSTFKSSQKENLQKRLRQQRKKLKAFNKQKPARKGQGINGSDSKVAWTLIIIVVAAFSVKLIQFGFSALLGSAGGSGWLILVGFLLLILSFVAFFILYPRIFDFLF